jgi:hypothetical protein
MVYPDPDFWPIPRISDVDIDYDNKHTHNSIPVHMNPGNFNVELQSEPESLLSLLHLYDARLIHMICLTPSFLREVLYPGEIIKLAGNHWQM